jgi:glycosyltransferase involved in cell wall biosynthesis
VRVVFLNPTGHFGGAEAALVELLNGVAAAQPTWSFLVVAASDGPFVDRVRRLGMATQVVPFPPSLARLGEWGASSSVRAGAGFVCAALRALPQAAAYGWRLGRAVRRFTPDVVHSNGAKMHLLAPLVAPRRAAVLWHVHDYIGRRLLTSRLLRSLAARVSAVVANSESVAAELRRELGTVPPVHCVWNAVDLERFQPAGAVLDLDARAGLPPAVNVCRVGLVATYARWKGHSTFLRAMAMLRDMPVRGYVIGGPVYATGGSQVTRAELESEVRRLGLDGRVGFLGFVEDPAAAMRALDIVVHASTEPEPFGLVIAEGMACGRAVVASAAGGAREIVEPGVTAVTHDPGDVGGLADALRALATDAAARARLGVAARSFAEQAFGRDRLTSDLLRVYRGLPPRRGPWGAPAPGRHRESPAPGPGAEPR